MPKIQSIFSFVNIIITNAKNLEILIQIFSFILNEIY